MFIDTHSHLNFRDFDKDWEEVAKRSLKNNTWVINASSNFFMSEKAVKIAESFEKGIYALIGLHPLNATVDLSKKLEDKIEESFDYGKYKKLALSSKKVVGVGECGFDAVSWERKDKKTAMQIFEKQKQVLIEQVGLAKELGLPIVLHCRKAHKELLNELGQIGNGKTGVLHCFTGNFNQAKQYLEMGFYLGFNGIIFKYDVEETIKRIPLDKIVLETDCPFLTPPQQAKKRNEPIFVKYVAEKISQIKKVSVEEVEKITTDNSKFIFNIK